MEVVTDSKEQLDVFMSDVTEGAHVCENATVGLLSVGAEGMHRYIAMPVAAAG